MIAQSITLGTYAERFIRQRDLDSDYQQQIRSRVRMFEEWNGGAIPLEDLSDDLLNEYLITLKSKRAPKTIKGYRGCILCVWNGACEDDLTRQIVDRPGKIRIEKIPQQKIEAWPLEEIIKLIGAAKNLTGIMPQHRILLCHWWEARVRIGFDTALRHSDIMRLRKEDIGKDGVIQVIQSKTGFSHVVRVYPKTMDVIDAIGWPGDEILPWAWHPDKFFSDAKKLVASAGIKKGTFKWLRRSAASYADRKNPGAGRLLLGHRSDRVFDESYNCIEITKPDIVQPPEIL